MDLCACTLYAIMLVGNMPRVEGGISAKPDKCATGKFYYRGDTLVLDMTYPLKGLTFKIKIPPLYQKTDLEYCVGKYKARLGAGLVRVRINQTLPEFLIEDRIWMKGPPPILLEQSR